MVNPWILPPHAVLFDHWSGKISVSSKLTATFPCLGVVGIASRILGRRALGPAPTNRRPASRSFVSVLNECYAAARTTRRDELLSPVPASPVVASPHDPCESIQLSARQSALTRLLIGEPNIAHTVALPEYFFLVSSAPRPKLHRLTHPNLTPYPPPSSRNLPTRACAHGATVDGYPS